jgi:hypothetical protein
MSKAFTPLEKRSKSKAIVNKSIGFFLMFIGSILALFGIAIIRDALFDFIDGSSVVDRDRWIFAAICLIITVIGFMLGSHGWKRYRLGKKLTAISAEEVLEKDKRAPIVYIRSFRDDDKLLTQKDKMNLAASRLSFPVFATTSKEETMATILTELGPVIAIGNPREQLPELGAARIYFTDDEWQVKILELMQKAKLVILLGGPTKNLWWEIEQALQKLTPDKLICLELFDQGANHEAFEQDLEKMLHQPGTISSQNQPKRGLAAWIKDYGKVIYFDKDWSPKVSFIRPLSAKMGLYNRTINQFDPALRLALRPIFAQLGINGPRLPINKLTILMLIFVALVLLLVGYILLTEA